MRILLVSLCTVFALTPSVKAQGWDEYDVVATHVAGSVHMLTGAGGNLGVSVGPDGMILIDDQFTPMAEKIQTALDEIGPGPLRFVLNTHFHGDHTGGNEFFGAKAPIVSHVNVRERLTKEVSIRGSLRDPAAQGAWPVVTFDTSINFYFNDEAIEVVHFPNAHTDGDGVIFFRNANVIHAGDIFFSDRFPFVDLENGGSVQGVISAVEDLMKRCDTSTKVIPGHGELSDKAGLERYHAMLMVSVKQVAAWKKEGKSVEEVRGLTLGSEWDDWAWSFIPMDFWMETLYKSL
jgi:cyclase